MRDTKRMKKPINRGRLIIRADEAFSLYIRERDGFVCFTCGMKGQLRDGVMQCGHLISRRSYSTRWDELNAHCQCRGCNFRHEYDYEVYRAAFVFRYGEEAYQKLYAKSKSLQKVSNAELEEIAGYYTARLAALKNQRMGGSHDHGDYSGVRPMREDAHCQSRKGEVHR